MEIKKTIIVNTSADKVFKALTEPEELTQWFQDEAILEPKVTGKIRFTTLRELHPDWKLDRDYINDGIIKQYVPNKKLSYTWKFYDMPDFPETTVVWELEQIDPDKTKLELTHSGFTGKEEGNFSIESHNQGWTEALDKLAKYCQGS